VRATGKAEMSALECLQEVLAETQKAQSAAKEEVKAVPAGTKDEYETDDKRRELAAAADVEALHAKTQRDEFNDSLAAPALYCCCPCALFCSSITTSIRHQGSGLKITGLKGAVKYITTQKDTNAGYTWSIQNYHYEQRTRTVRDSEGRTRTETYTVRVNTHHASTRGLMACSDDSPMFIPNMRKRNCALASQLSVGLADEFKSEYSRRQLLWYQMNTRDSHQDKSASFYLPGMVDAAMVEWADDGEEDPWYASSTMMYLSMCTCCAACWFLKMREYMCEDSFTFRKRAHAFA